MEKATRLFAIKEIITALPISNQDDLRHELKKRGIKVTQATLSRDLKELGVGRIALEEGARYVLQQPAELQILRPLVGAEVLSITSNETLIVIRTLPGCASVVGEYIDAQKNPEIIGTLAGDNTLLIIPRSRKRINQLKEILKNRIIEKRS